MARRAKTRPVAPRKPAARDEPARLNPSDDLLDNSSESRLDHYVRLANKALDLPEQDQPVRNPQLRHGLVAAKLKHGTKK